MQNEQIIDIEQVEFYLEELRQHPWDTDVRLDELVKLYRQMRQQSE